MNKFLTSTPIYNVSPIKVLAEVGQIKMLSTQLNLKYIPLGILQENTLAIKHYSTKQWHQASSIDLILGLKTAV